MTQASNKSGVIFTSTHFYLSSLLEYNYAGVMRQ